MQFRLGIAVVTFNSDATLTACLKSIDAHCPTAFVVISENSGRVDAMRKLATRFPRVDVSVIDPGGNVGFARGVNIAASALRAAGCTHLLILNPDVELLSDPADLTSFLDQVDVVAGVLLGGDTTSRTGGRPAPTNAKHQVTWRSTAVQAVLGTRFNTVRTIAPGVLQRVPQLDGAYMFQTMDFYSNHPLDERFELYFEDVDYCDRARAERGVALLGTVVGRHAGGASYRSAGGPAYLVNRVSHARYLRRRYPRMPRPILLLPFTVELCTRFLTRQPEGSAVRAQALRLVEAELTRPGSVRVLQRHLSDSPPDESEAP